MSRRIFIDANVMNDIYDTDRRLHEESYHSLQYCLEQDMTLVTSCDIVTTVYYITSKGTAKAAALAALEEVNDIFEIVPFSNKLLTDTIDLMKQDTLYTDLEDTVQYLLAKQSGCDLILSNDGEFVSKDLPVMGTPAFLTSHQQQ